MTAFLLILFMIAAAALSWWLLGFLSAWLEHRQIVDTPNERTVHQGSVPRGGGLVIVALLAVVLMGVAIASERYWVFGGFTLLLLAWSGLSWWDDNRGLSPRFRLVFQVLIAIATLIAFGYVNSIQLGTNNSLYLAEFGIVVTFIGLMWMTNLYNFMDGMDGLAASQAIIAGLTLGFWFWQVGDLQLAFVSMLLAAIVYGFLLRNWHPAQIFLGDVGSIGLGAFFATLFIFANTRYQLPIISFVLLFGVFVFDTSVTILHRMLKREKFWLPHSSHHYQRLSKLGVNHAQIVVLNAILMLCCAMLASWSLIERDRIAVLIVIEFGLMFGYAVAVYILENNSKNKQI